MMLAAIDSQAPIAISIIAQGSFEPQARAAKHARANTATSITITSSRFGYPDRLRGLLDRNAVEPERAFEKVVELPRRLAPQDDAEGLTAVTHGKRIRELAPLARCREHGSPELGAARVGIAFDGKVG